MCIRDRKGAGSIQITFAWGLAVMVPAFIFGAASGAHFNPALTIALAVDGSFAWSMVPGYIVAQFAGAFVGACLVYILFKDQFDATDNPGTTVSYTHLPSPVCSLHQRFPGGMRRKSDKDRAGNASLGCEADDSGVRYPFRCV